MAEGFAQITDGAGKKLHTAERTIGANTVQDEYILHGEPDLATYGLDPGAGSNTTTINRHMFQIMAGSTLNVYVRWIGIYQTVLAGAVTVVPCQLRRLTTAGTGGTAGAFQPFDSTSAAVGATTIANPGVLGTEGVTLHTPYIVAVAALPPVPSPNGMLIWEFNPDQLRSKSIRIPAGTANGICLKNTVALATAIYSIQAIISEATY